MSNWLTSLFSSTPTRGDFSALKVDLHSHLIPGIDDGAPNMEESMQLITALKGMGYTKLITTPHIMPGYYDNNPHIIREGLEAVREELKRRGIDILIECGAEYYFDDYLFDLLAKKEVLTFSDNYLLFELPTINMPPRVRDFIFEANSMGIKPMLAHVERYGFMHDHPKQYEDLHDMDLFMQVNIGSLVGAYGEKVQKLSYKLIDAGIIEFLGSDLHGPRHIEHLEKALTDKRIQKLLKGKPFMNSGL